jgi:hypothetical protein
MVPMSPAVCVDRLLGFLGGVEVALHDVVPADHDLARLVGGEGVALAIDDADLDLGNRAAAGRCDGFGIVVEPTHGDDAAALREPVGSDHGFEPEVVFHPIDELDRDRGCAGHRKSQARDIELSELGVQQNRLIQGRGARQHRDGVFLNAPEHDVDVEHRLRVNRGAAHQRRKPSGLVAKTVKERQHDQISIAFAKAGDRAPLIEHPQVLCVRAHRAFGFASGARREENIGHVVRIDRRRALLGGGRRNLRGACQELRVAEGAFRCVSPQHDDLGEIGKLGVGATKERHVVDVEETRHGEEHLCPALLEQVCGLDAFVSGVDWDHHAANRVNRQRTDDPLPDVRRPNGDAIAFVDASGDEGSRCFVHSVGQLGEG